MSASGGIIFNEKKQLLIVKPNYREDWLIPGGVIEENESPSQACIREIKEEIDLELIPDKLLCIGYYPISRKLKKESFQFLFHIGVITQEQIDSIILQESELVEYRFIEYEKSKGILESGLFHQIGYALKAIKENRIIYLEDKKEIYPLEMADR